MTYNVYNYLVSDYVHRTDTQQRSHNSTELRNIYNKIVKMGQKTPIYLFHLSKDTEMFALGLKDSSIQLANSFSDLLYHGADSVYSSKTVYSKNDEVATASILTEDYSVLPEPFELQVHALAKPQKNLSSSFHPDYTGIKEGTYHFAIETDEKTSHYSIHVPHKTVNEKVFSGIASSINHGDSGVHASLVHDKKHNHLQLALESTRTGSVNHNLIFKIYDQNEKNTSTNGVISYYGIDHVVQSPQNASFSLNGEKKEALGNNFTLRHTLEVSLHSVHDAPVEISYQTDCRQISSLLNNMLKSYNHLVDFAKERSENQPRASLFLKELHNLYAPYHETFGAVGLTLDENSHLVSDPIITNQSILNGNFENFFSKDNECIQKFLSKLNTIILNPVEYIDKTVVTYPNPIKPNFPSPYVTSIYSGMLFNNYC